MKTVSMALLTGLTLALFLLAAPSAKAGGGCTAGTVTCSPHPTLARKVCSRNLSCNGLSPVMATVTSVTNTGVAGCTPTSGMLTGGSMVTFTLVASVSTNAQATHTCGWDWNTTALSNNGNVQIDSSDGLPIELLEFSIEDAPTD